MTNGIIVLENAFWKLEFMPEMGGALVFGEAVGYPVFSSARSDFTLSNDVFEASCFPLIPYSNRINSGQFSFEGQSHSLRPNHKSHDLPIHGNAWQQSWDVEASSKTQCNMSLVSEAMTGSWPWSYRAQQIIRLEDDMLIFQLSIENVDDQAFPAGLGLHPYFSGADKARVKFTTSAIWEAGDDLIPTRACKLTAENNFGLKRNLVGTNLDNCFSGWDGIAEISWPDFKRTIIMEASPNFSNLVVYNQPHNNFFCLEPVSHVNNALNGSGDSVSVLTPGKSLHGEIKFYFQI